jgi:hypothetical protein
VDRALEQIGSMGAALAFLCVGVPLAASLRSQSRSLHSRHKLFLRTLIDGVPYEVDSLTSGR